MQSLANVLPIRPQAAPPTDLSGRYFAHVVAAGAYRSAKGKVTEAAAKIERLFSGCADAGYGFPDECTALVFSELAAIATGAS